MNDKNINLKATVEKTAVLNSVFNNGSNKLETKHNLKNVNEI